jgi:hypothetical protein
MRTILGIAFALTLAGCKPDEGERCNPLLFNDECHSAKNGLSCVYPPGCGVAYCCAVAAGGAITSADPHCQACATDDAGSTD